MLGIWRLSFIKYASVLFYIFFILIVTSTGAMSETSDITLKKDFCKKVNGKFQKFGWNRIICKPDRWKTYDYSSKGNPLLYQEFGFDNKYNRGPVNLVFCGVHGDEPTGIYQCFHLVREFLFDNPGAAKKYKIVVAPIINPDGFLANTRQNANGVDINRNLPTKDWDSKAHRLWNKKHKDRRRYPGQSAGSEAETRFQAYLIDKYKPDKILTFHAPLGFLDFDGPGDRKYQNLLSIEHRAKRVGLRIQKNTKRFLKFIDFRFYPGSLGNYAGNERKIPTYTVELPSVLSSKAHEYWRIMRFALIKALKYKIFKDKDINRTMLSSNTHNSKFGWERQIKN